MPILVDLRILFMLNDYIHILLQIFASLASSNQQRSTDTTGDWESPPLCPLRWWHTFGHLRSLGQVLGLPYYAFYLLPARFWELAAGVILYLFCAKVMTGEWLKGFAALHAQGGIMRNICFVTFLWLQFFNHILCFPGMSGWSLEVLRRNASFPRCWCDSLQYSLCSSCGLPCFSCDLSEKMEKWSIPMGPWAGLKIDCPHDSLPTMLFPNSKHNPIEMYASSTIG